MEKKCIVCTIKYLDSSNHKRGKTCSRACAAILMKETRFQKGSYNRLPSSCEQDQLSKQKIRREKFENLSQEATIEYYERVVSYEISRFPLGFFQFGDVRERGVWITKYIIEEKLQLPKSEILAFFTLRSFRKHRIGAQVLQKCFNRTLWTAVESCYPGQFKKWEKKNQHNIWNPRKPRKPKKSFLSSPKELLEFCRRKSSEYEDPRDFFTMKNLKEVNAYNSVSRHFGSLWEVIEACYPKKYHRWEVKNQNNIWQKDEQRSLAQEATKWLVQDVLGLSVDEVAKKVHHSDFNRHGLSSMLSCIYGYSFIEALIDVYPILSRNDFPLTMKLAKLGYEYERFCKNMLQEAGKGDICNSKFKVKGLLVPDLVFKEKHWGDLKLTTSGYYSSNTNKYLEHCNKLTIVYLIKNKTVERTKGLRFITIDKIVRPDEIQQATLKELKQRYYSLIKE